MRRRSFLLLTAGAAAAAAGSGVLVATRTPRAPKSINAVTLPLALLDERIEHDVCIVGSGIASAILANELLANDRRVVVLESGFAPTDQWRSGLEKLDVFHNAGALEYPLLQTRVRTLGGTTSVWTGNCLRYMPDDFESSIGGVPAWPIAYADIEPYYERAEQTLRVRAYDESRFAPPRRNSLSLPYGGRLRYFARRTLSAEPVPFSDLQEALAERGIESDQYPRSQVSRADPAPLRALHHWPSTSLDERLTLATAATVTRLVPDDSGRVVAAEAKDLEGLTKMVRARYYVVAAGGVESARLLQLSRSPAFPNGLGNGHDAVGRYFMESPDIQFETPVPADWRATFGRARLLQYHHPGFRDGLLGITIGIEHSQERPDVLTIGCGITMAPVAENRWSLARDMRDFFGNPVPALTLAFSELDLETLDRGRALVQQICKDLGAQPPVERPGLVWSHHHKGACRMGRDPATSVVDADCRLHESANCYLAGSAAFAGSGAGHPTLLLVALAHRLSDHLAARLA